MVAGLKSKGRQGMGSEINNGTGEMMVVDGERWFAGGSIDPQTHVAGNMFRI
jgi:hypothetical protein